MRVLAISGSLRERSFNTSLLRALEAALAAAAPHAEWQRVEPTLLGAVPPFNQDDEHEPAAVLPALEILRAQISAADVVVFSTPEYNASIPGQLKNVIDWLSRPFDTNPLRDRQVAVLSASDGQFGAVWANNELRKVLGTLGARVLERQVALPAADQQFSQDGTLRNTGTRRQLELLASDIAALAPAAVA